ncbi:MAG: universal stress protein [Planctomycetota bacterium]
MAATLVVTTDLSPESQRAFAPAAELARRLGLSLTLLHVVEELRAVPHGAPLAPPIQPPDLERHTEDARQRLDTLRTDLGADEAVILTADPVAQAIADYGAQHDAAFIAIATQGRSGLRHFVLGSVAEAVLQHATVPVLCYPPADAAD